MESRVVLSDGRVLTVQTESIEVTSMSPRPEPTWTHTDDVGHVHAYSKSDRGYPTLTWVQDEEDYVVIEDGYPEEYPGSGHYECVHCGEHIVPGVTGPSPFREFIPGVSSYALNGEPISEDEYRTLLSDYVETGR